MLQSELGNFVQKGKLSRRYHDIALSATSKPLEMVELDLF